MNYYSRYPGDYLRDTQHLSLAEHGAYNLLMDAYYATETPLPPAMDALYRVCRAMNKSEQAAVRSACEQFFPISDDGLRHHARIDSEIAKAHHRIDAARRNGSSGGRPLKPTDNPVGFETKTQLKPSGSPEQNPAVTQQKPSAKALHTPITKNQERETAKAEKPCPAGAGRFAEFWAVYPRHENRKKALESWCRKRLDANADAIIADVKRRTAEHRPWREGFVMHPTTYLNGERWNDDIDTSALRIEHHAVPQAPLLRAAI